MSNNTNNRAQAILRAGKFPSARPQELRPGVRYAESDFPGAGKFELLSPADDPGTLRNYGDAASSSRYPGDGLKAKVPMKRGRK